MEEITISLEEYKKLLTAQIKTEILTDCIKSQEYITTEECARILGFKLEEKK